MPPAFAVLTADLLLTIMNSLLTIFGPVGNPSRLALLFYQIRRGKSSVGGGSLCLCLCRFVKRKQFCA
jgi:hypothetical protein